MKRIILFVAISSLLTSAQRITTIQLDGVQYFISRMNPYSPELNYFLAYQYCRSLGLQLVSFETKEKTDIMMQYLKNAGYSKYNFWTSGNNLGTDMFLWMSSGLPFNATFDYMLKSSNNKSIDIPPGTEPQRVARESVNDGVIEGCVAMESPSLKWNVLDCMSVKDFICEQTRCYYYNYGSIPVSATQGKYGPYVIISTTEKITVTSPISESTMKASNTTPEYKIIIDKIIEEPISKSQGFPISTDKTEQETGDNANGENRPKHLPNIATLFTDSTIRKKNVFAGLETHEVRSALKNSANVNYDLYHSKNKDAEPTDAVFTEDHTVGPYDSIDFDFQADQADYILNYKKDLSPNVDDDSSTTIPEIEPFYKYNIKVRNNGKVLGSSVK